MKRILIFVVLAMMLGSSMIKTSRSTLPEIKETPTLSMVNEVDAIQSVAQHKSEFSDENLHQLVGNNLNQSQHRIVCSESSIRGENAIHNVVEVIQIIDEETGTVIAKKIVNNP